MRWAVWLALGLSLVAGSAESAAEKRIALVIGQNGYQMLSKLNNPVADGKSIAAVLRDHGFEVTEHYDLPRAEFLDALETFRDQSETVSVALVYYAGHGLEVAGKNVLAPVDMDIDCEKKVPRRAIGLEELFDAVSGAPQQIVLLDACRNDPFPQCPSRSVGGGGGFRGFTRVGSEGRSLLIANATLSGQLAADGEAGRHSPFAKALLARFETDAHLFLRDLLDHAAGDVSRDTHGMQSPEILTRAGAPRVCLDPLCGGNESAATPKPVPSSLPANSDSAQQAWEAVQSEGTDVPGVYEAFLRQYPEGVYAELARVRLSKLKQTAPAPVPQPKGIEIDAAAAANDGYTDAERARLIELGRYRPGSPPVTWRPQPPPAAQASREPEQPAEYPSISDDVDANADIEPATPVEVSPPAPSTQSSDAGYTYTATERARMEELGLLPRQKKKKKSSR